MLAILLGLFISPFVVIYVKREKRPRINRKQELSSDKVVSTCDIEDIGDKKVFCRCWKSDKVKLVGVVSTRHWGAGPGV